MPDFAAIVTALDETHSLSTTLDKLVEDNRDDLDEIILATAPITTSACRKVIVLMKEKYPDLVREHEQSRLPGLGGALQECAATAKAKWTIIMSSDLETPPDRVAAMIARAKEGDVDIVATSRWIEGGGMGNYSKMKAVCNWIFQKAYSTLYGTNLTDMTYGFRIYRTELLNRYRWQETGHAFFMESLCKPLREGKRIVELPVQWTRRVEGESHIVAIEFLRYFRIGISCRFGRVKNMLAEKATGKSS